jgi:hypothetical protein
MPSYACEKESPTYRIETSDNKRYTVKERTEPLTTGLLSPKFHPPSFLNENCIFP